MRTHVLLSALALFLLTMSAIGCASSGDPLLKPSFATMSRAAPDSFDVEVVTSEGTIGLRFYREWSPLGVDRAHYLFGNNFYEGARFYRVVEGFVAQFGGSGDAKIDSLWRTMSIADEPVKANNERGTISYARAGPRTRSFTFYINLQDNFRLDTDDSNPDVRGYPPVGRVVSGMDVVDRLHAGYGNQPMRTNLTAEVLAREYPELDSIAVSRVTQTW